MQKQKIRPKHFFYYGRLSLWIFSVAVSLSIIIIVILESRYDPVGLGALVFSIIALPICIIIFTLDIKKSVVFNNDNIFVAADPADKNGLIVRKFQHKTSILYNEIKDISFTVAATDSLGRNVEGVFLPRVYIVFECKDGKEKAINAHFYTKKQTVQIINETKRRAAAVGNELNIESGEVLLKEFLQEANKRKKRKTK